MAHDLSAMDKAWCTGFVARPGPKGDWPWTLTTLLGSFLAEAEARFGERNKDWTILGIELSASRPAIWYPHFGGRWVLVRLCHGSAYDLPHLVFQLAQEIVHLLEPSGERSASRFEEGVATFFAKQIITGCGIGITLDDPAYLQAEADVLALGPDTDAIVRAVRAVHGSLSRITPAGLTTAVPGCDPHLAEALCRPFE